MRKSVLVVNAIVLAGMVCIPAGLYNMYTIIMERKASTVDMRSEHMSYAGGRARARDMFKEFNETEMQFRAFTGWQRRGYKGKFVNVDENTRLRMSTNQEYNNSVWFVGGSTIWGTGSADGYTIPSIYAKITEKKVLNLGESDWNSRQSVNRVLNLLAEGKRPERIVLYEGVNDVAHGCRGEGNMLQTHSREVVFRERVEQPFNTLIKERSAGVMEWSVRPWLKLLSKLGYRPDSEFSYTCSTDRSHARKVAEFMLTNWKATRAVGRAFGAEVKGVLQPVWFTATQERVGIAREDVMREEYLAVYREMKGLMQEECKDEKACWLVDGSMWLAGRKDTFIDYCHLSEEGNSVIAGRLSKL